MSARSARAAAGIERAGGKVSEIDGVAGEVPADVCSGDVFHCPGAQPTARAGDGNFSGIGIAWRQRLKNVEDLPIAKGPGNEREQRDKAKERGGSESAVEHGMRRCAYVARAEDVPEEAAGKSDEKDQAVGAKKHGETGCTAGEEKGPQNRAIPRLRLRGRGRLRRRQGRRRRWRVFQ